MQQDGGQASQPTENIDIAVTFLQGMLEKAVAYIPSVVGALVVLIVGLWVAGRVKKIAVSAMGRTGKIDETLGGFLSSLIYYGLVALVIITTLGVFGVPTTSFAAIIGAAGLAIGLALQGTLGHVASGVMMLGFRPFDVGDFVEAAGVSGSVKNIGLFTTEIATPDNKMIIVPNGKIFDDVIVNYAGYPTRRVDLVFGISYADDIDKAMALLKSELDKDDRILSDPAPVIEVGSLGDSSVNILCRPWVKGGDYWAVYWSLTKAVKQRFDEENVSFPFPSRSLYIEKQAS
ncbi:MAG: mechanosensitive ion channel domain-containing protein [Pseudomonadota bacterium]